MITNASLLSLTPATFGPGGDPVLGTPVSYGVRCTFDGLTNRQQWSVNEAGLDVTMALYVPLGVTPDLATISLLNARASVLVDGADAPIALTIRRFDKRLHGAVSHWEFLVREA